MTTYSVCMQVNVKMDIPNFRDRNEGISESTQCKQFLDMSASLARLQNFNLQFQIFKHMVGFR